MKQQIKLLFIVFATTNCLYAGRNVYPVNVRPTNIKQITGGQLMLDLSGNELPSLKGLQPQDVAPCAILNFSNNRVPSIGELTQLPDNAGPRVGTINFMNNNLRLVTCAWLAQLHKIFPHLNTLNLMGNPNLDEAPIKQFRTRHHLYTIHYDDGYTADSDSSSSSNSSPSDLDTPSSEDDSDGFWDHGPGAAALAEHYAYQQLEDADDDDSSDSSSSSGGYYDSGQRSADDDDSADILGW